MNEWPPAPTCRCGHAFAEADPPDIRCPACGLVQSRAVPGSDSLALVGYEPEVWIAASFAREWFADALREASTDTDVHARRRQIIFAVCFVESYLFEWTRDLVGPKEVAATYFPPGVWSGIRDRWKRVMGDLKANARIPQEPVLSGSQWAAFVKLVEYRDGLVHAAASRPSSSARPPREGPTPALGVLQAMEAGWPVRVVVALVKHLHATVGTAPPPWLTEP